MYSHESLTEIQKDPRLAFIQAMRGDYQSVTDASATIITENFMQRIEAFTQTFAYQEARRLNGFYTKSARKDNV